MRILVAGLLEHRNHVGDGPAVRVNVGILEAGQVGCRIGSRRGLNIEDEDILVPHGQGVPRVLYTGESLFPDPGVISVPGRWRTSP